MTYTRFKEIFNDKDFISHASKAFKNYIEFLNQFYGIKKSPKSLYGYCEHFFLDDVDVYVTCINSCLSNTIVEDKAISFLDTDFMKKNIHPKDKENLSIFIMHHPLDSFYIDNKREIDTIITDMIDIFIHGHEHVPDYSVIQKQSGKSYIKITNGCTYLADKENPEHQPFRFSILSYDPVVNELTIQFWHTRKDMHFCSVGTSVDPTSKETGIIKLTVSEKISKYGLDQFTNPLPDQIPDELLSVFERNLSSILKLKDRKSAISFRNKINTKKSYSLRDFAKYLLKYLLDEDFIEDYDELSAALNEIYLFRELIPIHKRILDYYKSKLEEKQESIAVRISKRKKSFNLKKLLKDLEKAKEEIKALKSQRFSIIESYINRPINLLPIILNEDEEPVSECFDWYKDAGLKSDPFPSNDGLENIAEDLFDIIIVNSTHIGNS